MRIFGDSDYECWYIFDADQERMLEAALHGQLTRSKDAQVPEDVGALLGLAFSAGFFETASDLRPF